MVTASNQIEQFLLHGNEANCKLTVETERMKVQDQGFLPTVHILNQLLVG